MFEPRASPDSMISSLDWTPAIRIAKRLSLLSHLVGLLDFCVSYFSCFSDLTSDKKQLKGGKICCGRAVAYRGREDKFAGGQGSGCAHICHQEVESGQDVGMVIDLKVSWPNDHFLLSPHPQLSPHWLSKNNPFSCCDF